MGGLWGLAVALLVQHGSVRSTRIAFGGGRRSDWLPADAVGTTVCASGSGGTRMAQPFVVGVKIVVRNADGQYLLVRAPDRGWEVPGG